MDYKIIDINSWERSALLKTFLSMSNPFFGGTVEVDITDFLAYCKKEKLSFYLSFVHVVSLAADSIPGFRLRIHQNPDGSVEIREYSEGISSHTEPTSDGQYCYCNLRHHMSWEDYIEYSKTEQIKAGKAAVLEDDPGEVEAYYFVSCIPWARVTGVLNPTNGPFDSNPRITWSKFEEDYRGRIMMPVSLYLHHALADGKQFCEFFEAVEREMNAIINASA